MWESEEAYGTSNDFGILRLATTLTEYVLTVRARAYLAQMNP